MATVRQPKRCTAVTTENGFSIFSAGPNVIAEVVYLIGSRENWGGIVDYGDMMIASRELFGAVQWASEKVENLGCQPGTSVHTVHCELHLT
jgi:hypothetical protein